MRKSVDLLLTATALAIWGSLSRHHGGPRGLTSARTGEAPATQRPSCLAFYTTERPVDPRAPCLAI